MLHVANCLQNVRNNYDFLKKEKHFHVMNNDFP